MTGVQSNFEGDRCLVLMGESGISYDRDRCLAKYPWDQRYFVTPSGWSGRSGMSSKWVFGGNWVFRCF